MNKSKVIEKIDVIMSAIELSKLLGNGINPVILEMDLTTIKSLILEEGDSGVEVHGDSKRCFNCLHWNEQWSGCRIQRGNGNINYKCSKWE